MSNMGGYIQECLCILQLDDDDDLDDNIQYKY